MSEQNLPTPEQLHQRSGIPAGEFCAAGAAERR